MDDPRGCVWMVFWSFVGAICWGFIIYGLWQIIF